MKRDCMNRVCTTCGAVGHTRCRSSQRTQQCWECLGRHTKGGNCSGRVFSPHTDETLLDANKEPICPCGSTSHIACTPLQYSGRVNWATDVLVHCTLCGEDAHSAYECRRPAFVSTLIRHQRVASEQGTPLPDPRFPLHKMPEGLDAGPPIIPPQVPEEEGGDSEESSDEAVQQKKEDKMRAQGRSPAARARRAAKKSKKKQKQGGGGGGGGDADSRKRKAENGAGNGSPGKKRHKAERKK